MAFNNDSDQWEKDTLKALIESDGYKLYLRLIEQEWGADATLQKIDHALKDIPRGDDSAVNDTVQQIQAARREVMKAVELPMRRLRQVSPPRLPERAFAAFRRTSR